MNNFIDELNKMVAYSINDTVLHDIRSFVSNTLRRQGIDYIEHLVLSESDESTGQGLITHWDNCHPYKNANKVFHRLSDDSGKNTIGQTSYAHKNKISLWIVKKNKSQLKCDDKSDYIDKWSSTPSCQIPKYISFNDYKIKTSIICPITINGSSGVVNFESKKYFEPNDKIKQVLLDVSHALHRLYLRVHEVETLYNEALHAIDKVISYTVEPTVSDSETPYVFFASPDKSDEKVIGIVKEVFNKQFPNFHLIFWRDISDSGNVDTQIVTKISQCKYGVCYFSEQKMKKGKALYFDNVNVVFEAGMLHILCNGESKELCSVKGWLPIREKCSSKPPFDFSHERILKVDRLNGGNLNEESFRTALTERLKSLLS